jgi:L-malate glycosyltransferase
VFWAAAPAAFELMSPAPPLRLGIVCYPLIGGSGILATELGHALADRGHEVHFFSYAQPVRLHVSRPRIHFHPVQVSEYGLFKYPDYTLPLAVRMAEVARSHALDLWHVHYAVPHATAAFLARQILGTSRPRILTTLHGTDTTLLGQDPNYQAVIEHALDQSDLLTTVSHALRRQTEATFALRRPVRVIHNFFAPEPVTRGRAEVRAELGVDDATPLVLHMSNLRPVKRIDLLLEAFAMARSREPMRLLILAGGSIGPYQAALHSLGLGDAVIVRENVGNVEDYLQASDLAFHTSEMESFGLSILESQFFALPVVAFDVGGIHEVVANGETGHLLPFGDTEAAADALVALARDRRCREIMGRAAAARARDRFSAARIVPQYEALYRELVEGDIA